MKYAYSTLAVIGLVAGIVLFLWHGLHVEPLLALIFGAVCAVAAEVSELADKITAQGSGTTEPEEE